MTGYHLVRIFWISTSRPDDLRLPEGWKPFSTVYETDGSGLVGIVCRKWQRVEATP